MSAATAVVVVDEHEPRSLITSRPMPLLGQSVVGIEDPPHAVYTGPWFSRQSDAATFVAQTLHIGTNCRLVVTVEHKNIEDADSAAATVATFSTISAVGTSVQSATGLKELVRFVYTVSTTSGTDWVHYRMLAPIWQPN